MLEIPFVVGESGEYRIDLKYKVRGGLWDFETSLAVGVGKAAHQVWVEAEVVDSNGNYVPDQVGSYRGLYRTDLGPVAFAVDAGTAALSQLTSLFGQFGKILDWASAVYDVVSFVEPTHVFPANQTYTDYLFVPLQAGKAYKLRIILGHITAACALGADVCVAMSATAFELVSVALPPSTPSAPKAPDSIRYPTASASGLYTVSWSTSAGTSAYRLEYSDDGGNTWKYAYSGPDTSVQESRGNGRYRYRVRASNSNGNSEWTIGAHDCVVNIEGGEDAVVVSYYNATEDTYIYEYEPNRNFGSEPGVSVINFGTRAHTLLKFGGLDIPSNARLRSAKLNLYAANGRTTVPHVAAYLTSWWAENTVTWNTAPTLELEPVRPIVGSFPSLNEYYAWVNLDVTSFVREWVENPARNHGLLIAANNNDTILWIKSREYSSGNRCPYLRVEFFESVSVPRSVTGPNEGETYQPLNFTASGAASDLGDPVEYQFDWGDGTSSEWGNSSRNKTYTNPGTYSIKARARCSKHTAARSSWSDVLKTVTIRARHVVSPPEAPAGPDDGYIGTVYQFSARNSACSLGHAVQYKFSWGDGTHSGWCDGTAFKSYDTPQTYSVKVRARCSHDTSVISEWSAPKQIRINPIPTHRLQVTSAGAGPVEIQSRTGHGGSTPYQYDVEQHTAVHLEAPEYVGVGSGRKRFIGWSGAVSATNRAIAFIMETTTTVVANFIDDPEVNRAPDKPSLISPTNGAAGISLNPSLQASAFSDSDGDTHANSHWQVDNNSDFISPEWDSGESVAATQTTVPSGRLNYSTKYYWRVRYKDSRGAWSEWATPNSFTTVAAPVVLDISPTSQSHTSAAATGQTIAVTANVAWTATSNATWVTITGGASGTGNGTVTYSVAENTGAARTATITVSGGGITRTFTVNQAGPVADTQPPVVRITTPTSEPTWTSPAAAMNLGGTATDNVGVTALIVRNHRDVTQYDAVRTGTNWTLQNLPLQQGLNIIDAIARDAAGNSARATLRVTYNGDSWYDGGLRSGQLLQYLEFPDNVPRGYTVPVRWRILSYVPVRSYLWTEHRSGTNTVWTVRRNGRFVGVENSPWNIGNGAKYAKIYTFEAEWTAPDSGDTPVDIYGWINVAQTDGARYLLASIPDGVDPRPGPRIPKVFRRTIVPTAGSGSPGQPAGSDVKGDEEPIREAEPLRIFDTAQEIVRRSGAVVTWVNIPDNWAPGTQVTCQWKVLSYMDIESQLAVVDWGRQQIPVEVVGVRTAVAQTTYSFTHGGQRYQAREYTFRATFTVPAQWAQNPPQRVVDGQTRNRAQIFFRHRIQDSGGVRMASNIEAGVDPKLFMFNGMYGRFIERDVRTGQDESPGP